MAVPFFLFSENIIWLPAKFDGKLGGETASGRTHRQVSRQIFVGGYFTEKDGLAVSPPFWRSLRQAVRNFIS